MYIPEKDISNSVNSLSGAKDDLQACYSSLVLQKSSIPNPAFFETHNILSYPNYV